MLRRRPDLRVAERTLAAETARLGVATADLYPRVTLSGSVGVQATSFLGLGSGSERLAVGPGIFWAAFDLGRVRARLWAQDARAEAALARYEQRVLLALEDTENALVDLTRQQARREFLQTSAQASESAANLARLRYQAGVADFLTVLDAERTLLESQDRLAESATRTATALIAVYKALGGGWQIELAGEERRHPSATSPGREDADQEQPGRRGPGAAAQERRHAQRPQDAPSPACTLDCLSGCSRNMWHTRSTAGWRCYRHEPSATGLDGFLVSLKSSVSIATSLDGFIARDDGNLDWLPGTTASTDDYG